MLDTILSMFGWEKDEPARSSSVYAPTMVNVNASPQPEKKMEQPKPPKKWSIYPCPFCGGNVMSFMTQTILTGGRHDGQHWVIFCEKCGAKGSLSPTKDEAVEKWNRPALEHNRMASKIGRLEKEAETLKESMKKMEEAEKNDPLLKCLESWPRPPFEWRTVTVARPRPAQKSSRVAAGRRKRSRTA